MIASSKLISAHPGIGIVKDSQGNIFYTDLKQVWKITKEGKRTIAVPNVHTHELYIDANDNLFGEHLWYNGEQKNTWGHYLWSLKNDGPLIKLKDDTEGFPTDYSFLRDEAGNMYWVERFKISRFKKKTPDGTITTIAEGKFKDIRWLHCSKDGTIYFIDLDQLYKLDTKGKVKLLAGELNENSTAFAMVGERHNAYGIWTDQLNNIYVALHGAQKVKKITPEGVQSSFLHSISPWSPTNGIFDDGGNLWLLEYTMTGQCRVRKISKDDLNCPHSNKASLVNNVLPFAGIASIAFIMILMIKRTIQNKRAVR